MLWVVVGRRRRPRGKRPGRASGGRPAALHVTDDTARHLRYTSRAKREADVSLSHRCTMEHHDATGVSPEKNGVKASPHRHNWLLSRGALAAPSDPWNSHAAPVSPRHRHPPNAGHAYTVFIGQGAACRRLLLLLHSCRLRPGNLSAAKPPQQALVSVMLT